MYFLYIIQSTQKLWRYIGITDDFTKRLAEHNAGKTRSTKAYRPYILIHTEAFADKTSARKRELHLKKNAQARQELFMALSSNG